jgi:hypothetical protein
VKRFTTARRLFVALAIAGTIVAAGATGAGAKSGPSQVTVPMNFSFGCGLSTKKGSGTATFVREKGLLTVTTKLRNAFPGKYRVILGTVVFPGICTAVTGFFDTFGVDGSGEGRSSKTIAMPFLQTFVIAAVNFDNGAVYQSGIVKIGSS